MENVFRCYYCDELKSMDFHKPYNDITLCVRCYPVYSNMCKPKVIDHRKDFDNDDEPSERIPKKTFKKNR